MTSYQGFLKALDETGQGVIASQMLGEDLRKVSKVSNAVRYIDLHHCKCIITIAGNSTLQQRFSVCIR